MTRSAQLALVGAALAGVSACELIVGSEDQQIRSSVSACPGATRTKISCAAPLSLTNGGQATAPAIAVARGNFVTAFATTTGVQLDETTPAGAAVGHRTFTVDGTPHSVAVGGATDGWALAWGRTDTNIGDYWLDCTTSATDGGRVEIDVWDAGYAYEEPQRINIASATGGQNAIAFNGSSSSAVVAIDAGCPRTYVPFAPSNLTSVYAAVPFAVSGQSTQPWHFLVNGANGSGAAIGLATLSGATLDNVSQTLSSVGSYALVAVPSSDGSKVSATFLNNDSATNQLSTQGVTFKLSPAAPLDSSSKSIGASATWSSSASWSSASCGAGCLASALITDSTVTGDVSLTFTQDDGSFSPLGFGTYDFACGQTLNGNGQIAMASSGTKLGILLTNGAEAKLFLCDTPAF